MSWLCVFKVSQRSDSRPNYCFDHSAWISGSFGFRIRCGFAGSDADVALLGFFCNTLRGTLLFKTEAIIKTFSDISLYWHFKLIYVKQNAGIVPRLSVLQHLLFLGNSVDQVSKAF